MAITLNGDGSISGLSSGAGISASALSGQVPDANAPSGSVIQVVNALKTDAFSTNSGSAVDITGLTATITPVSSTSKILVITTFFAGSGSSPYPKFKLLRNGTEIFLGDAVGSSTRQSAACYAGVDGATTQSVSVATQYLDSPATTSAVTYKWQVSCFSSRTIYIGRSEVSSDANGNTTPSSVTLMEISA